MEHSAINTDSDEISLKGVILKIRSGWNYILSRWVIIMIAAFVGGLLGLAYSLFKKPIYTATSTFVLEDNKSGGLGQYASLASLAGIDVGGATSVGIFQGDNLLELYKSRLMIEKTLLSQIVIDGEHQLLIDRYIAFNHLRDNWKNKKQLADIVFVGNSDNFNRQQDSIIEDIVATLNKKMLAVTKPDKKLSIIQVDVSTQDELFSKVFNDKLVENVNNFYTQTKTKKSSQNVLVLQRQADSVRRVLNSSISGVATAIDASPNANPNQVVLRVPSQKRQIDVQANTSIYAEIVKNLEIARLTLRQETPLIQIIDAPILPLQVTRSSKLIDIFIGVVATSILIITYLVFKKLYRNVMIT